MSRSRGCTNFLIPTLGLLLASVAIPAARAQNPAPPSQSGNPATSTQTTVAAPSPMPQAPAPQHNSHPYPDQYFTKPKPFRRVTELVAVAFAASRITVVNDMPPSS